MVWRFFAVARFGGDKSNCGVVVSLTNWISGTFNQITHPLMKTVSHDQKSNDTTEWNKEREFGLDSQWLCWAFTGYLVQAMTQGNNNITQLKPITFLTLLRREPGILLTGHWYALRTWLRRTPTSQPPLGELGAISMEKMNSELRSLNFHNENFHYNRNNWSNHRILLKYFSRSTDETFQKPLTEDVSKNSFVHSGP